VPWYESPAKASVSIDQDSCASKCYIFYPVFSTIIKPCVWATTDLAARQILTSSETSLEESGLNGEVEHLEASTVRVLVVDDHEPFRRFVCATLGQRPDLDVIGEASDGLEAVHKAEELKPDLIVLDIGLPTLNGMEVARRIRKLCPECKILFMSQGSSLDVAQAAFSLGAMGYVVKAHAGSELLAAVESVCQGRRFVSKGLSGFDRTGAADPKIPGQFEQEVPPTARPGTGEGQTQPSGSFLS
jgi:DNA-binding NarL/FixJ family response regulator